MVSIFKDKCTLTIKNFNYESDNGVYTINLTSPEIMNKYYTNLTKTINYELKVPKKELKVTVISILSVILLTLLLTVAAFSIYQKIVTDILKVSLTFSNLLKYFLFAFTKFISFYIFFNIFYIFFNFRKNIKNGYDF